MPDRNAELLQKFMPLVESTKLTQRRLERIIKTVSNRQAGLMVLMESVQNPHNLAAIARTCDAFGVQELAYTLHEQGLEGNVTDGDISSATAAKWLDYRQFEQGTDNAIATLKSEGWHIIGTQINPEAQSLYEIDFTQHEKIVLMAGSEWHGLSDTAVAQVDTSLYIPMMGMLESFNVSVATALCLFEITRQRRASEKDFSLSDEAATHLVEEFILRSTESHKK